MTYVLVVSLAKHDPMCTLFFTHLAGRLPLRIVQYPVDDIAGPLSGASAVIVVRGLFEFGNLIGCATRLGAPLYYFQDDNFAVIREEAGTYGTSYEKYTPDRIRSALKDFSGVLLATPALMTYFADQRLHDRLLLYPPVAGPVLAPPAGHQGHPLTVAFFGGLHRREPFVRHVCPAVRRLAEEMPIRLIAAGIESGSFPVSAGLEIVYLPYDASYTAALTRVARLGVDILVHPSNATANNAYKNPHVLINARAIGAAPVFSHVPPYDAVAGEGVALLCEDDEEAWHRALAHLATNPGSRQAIQTRLVAYCERHFSGQANAATIDGLLRVHPGPERAARLTRLVAGATCLAVGHAWRRIDAKVRRSA